MFWLKKITCHKRKFQTPSFLVAPACLEAERPIFSPWRLFVCLCVFGQEVTSSWGHNKRGHHRDTTGSAWGQHKIRSSEQSYEC